MIEMESSMPANDHSPLSAADEADGIHSSSATPKRCLTCGDFSFKLIQGVLLKLPALYFVWSLVAFRQVRYQQHIPDGSMIFCDRPNTNSRNANPVGKSGWSSTLIVPSNGEEAQEIAMNQNGTILALGIPTAKLGWVGKGKVLLYALTGEECEEWSHVGTFWGSRSAMLFGTSLSLSQDASRIVIGAYESGQFTVLERQVRDTNKVGVSSWNWKVVDGMPITNTDDKTFGSKVEISSDGSTIVTSTGRGFAFFESKKSGNLPIQVVKLGKELRPFGEGEGEAGHFLGFPKSTLVESSLSSTGDCFLTKSDFGGTAPVKLYQRIVGDAARWDTTDGPQVLGESTGTFYFMDNTCSTIAFLEGGNVTILEYTSSMSMWQPHQTVVLDLKDDWTKGRFAIVADYNTVFLDVETNKTNGDGHVDVYAIDTTTGEWRKEAQVERGPNKFDPKLTVSADGGSFAVGSWESGTVTVYTRQGR